MVIIVSGVDRTGKSTLIKGLQDHFYFRNPNGVVPVHLSYYTSFKTPKAYSKEIYSQHYKDGFEIIKNNNIQDRIRIFSRFHFDEYVYGSMYRNYNTEYIFNMEKIYKSFLNKVKYILLTDSAENVIARDDGDSHTIDLDLKRKEINLFKEAYDKSIITNKLMIDISNKTPEEVLYEATRFIK
tara:strand:- start:4173 stop:4721 length:549 start_codon:yes stop_codon:yes gene_type:complete